MPLISAAVEGVTDIVVAQKLIEHVGADAGPLHNANGKSALRAKLPGYRASAQFKPWLVLVDLDHSHTCPVALRADWIPEVPQRMCFRVVVRSVEAWLLADADGIARFLRVSKASVPRDPESLADPKAAVVNLAARSRSSDIRDGLVPRPGGGRAVGPLYTSTIARFVRDQWSIQQASAASTSLARAIRCMQRLLR